MGKKRTLEEARDAAVRLLKKYQQATEGQRTPILRELAETIVEIRTNFQRPDGTTDWRGRSYAYRVFIRELYEKAHYSKTAMNTVQAAVRYHVGAVLREQLTPEQLQEYGLVEFSPRERSRDQRQTKSATLNALTSREMHGGALLAISAAYTVLSRLDDDSLTDLDDRSRRVAEESLKDIERRAKQLQKRLNAG